jgi:hypothetical protein
MHSQPAATRCATRQTGPHRALHRQHKRPVRVCMCYKHKCMYMCIWSSCCNALCNSSDKILTVYACTHARTHTPQWSFLSGRSGCSFARNTRAHTHVYIHTYLYTHILSMVFLISVTLAAHAYIIHIHTLMHTYIPQWSFSSGRFGCS